MAIHRLLRLAGILLCLTGIGGITIPKDTHIVYVEAHDNEHGWSPQRVRMDLHQAKGERFTVQRKE